MPPPFIDADKDQGCGKAWEVLFANGMALQYFEKEEDADHFIASGKKDPGWFDFNRKRYTWVKREGKPPHHCWPVNKKPIEWIPSEKDSYLDGELAPVNPSGVELGEERERMIKYYKKLISALLIVGGSSLLLEHLFQFGGFDLFDFFGHEYYGLAMIVIAFLLSIKWKQLPAFLDAIKNRQWIKVLDEGER